ncbi:hypothetical protein [Oceanobacillus chungangensis]|uniref:Lipoprotein n=1 Tax=Oceanobacillus chungangensis TaxID=1229152 RepID=A0A3D8PXR8_9BACI|nr:hypothetical protein [Oceanobacillus chungangensis]RDW20572.1 hypothetical protein CWR45_04875 [Oceanobacillus chungangensis]
MKDKLLFKLGASIIALSMITACGMGTNKAPVKEEAPRNEAPLNEERNNNAPVEDNLNDGNIPQDEMNRQHKEDEKR